MPTKTKGPTNEVESVQTIDGQTYTRYSTRKSSETITYGAGPRSVHGLPLWKPCAHFWTNKISGELGSCTRVIGVRDTHKVDQTIKNVWHFPNVSYSTPSAPLPPIADAMDKFWDSVDLNTDEAVMAYSALVQAMPLVGGVLKANSVLSKISKWATKELRRRPFTEVVKTAISADFINRFVIQTTLQDIRMAADSMNYVLRVLDTAHNRNMSPTAFKPAVTNSVMGSSGSGSQTIGNQRLSYDWVARGVAQTKLFILADVRYDVDATTPLRLLANRLGLTRPLESAWDLVPFSFVIDYFTRCGDFLTEVSKELVSIDGLKGQVCSIYGIWVTTKKSTELSLKASRISKPGLSDRYEYLVYDSTLGEATRSTGEFHRQPLTGIDSQRGFWDRGRFLNVNLSTTRWRTIAELFLQAKL